MIEYIQNIYAPLLAFAGGCVQHIVFFIREKPARLNHRTD